jgi:urea ABC transporter ATP-binding protein UrtE
MLTIQSVQIGYGNSTVIWDVDLTVEDGQITAVLGRNGAGKTTLLRGIMGQLSCTSGNVYFNGENLHDLKQYQVASEGISYVPQSRDIFPDISVENNIRLGSASRSQYLLDNDIGDYIYDYFPALEDIKDRKGGALSGGQQQQLAIARALNADPELLLLDEPSEGVQPSIVNDLASQLPDIASTHDISILIVEQDLEFALNVADYCYILENGRIVEEGTPNELEESGDIEEHLVV